MAVSSGLSSGEVHVIFGVVSVASATKNDGAFVVGGYATPFDLAAACLCVGGAVIALEWSENYGTPVKSTSLRVVSNLQGGAHAVARDSRILLLGGVSACFEAAMYAFVFEWTPSLKVEGAPDPPYGEIFSIMMLACMCGTRVFGIAQRRVKPDRSTRVLLLVSVAALAVPATTAGPTLCVLSFLVFEVCVGVYFPAVSTLKSNLVPDAIRSTVYNLFRVPLNLLVLAILLSHISTRVIFLASVALLVLAALMQHRLCLLLLHADASAEPKTTTTTIARLDDRDDDDKKPLYETADV
ncbi:hypothetical protein CTAYLR_010419 [Chrysophaeum taylorii]|uniref:Molybdate-anion transporter n=1 Tax=Chrysophaeum taylorii TaxID=2483200 RepID=A0AAD7UGE8_9STRA|nr:hypothetical protein CTAYLR_010419 [Chrysophaeum taylorii]